MAWAIKRSFMDYLLRVGDARWDFAGGAALTTGQELYFPLAAEQPGWPAVALAGSATISGHFGALHVVLDRPVIRLEPGGTLTAGGEALVTVEPPPAVLAGDVVMWRIIDVALSAEAVLLFNGAYAAGEAFDPITLRVPHTMVPAPVLDATRTS
jgi:hypothetical protein